MRTVIAGSRTIFDYKIVEKAILDSHFTITSVICGMAPGVDSLGYRWAYTNHIPIHQFTPDWKTYGKSAGHLNNFEMCANADCAIIVWDGVCPMTKSLLEYARKCNVKVYKVLVAVDSLITQGRNESSN